MNSLTADKLAMIVSDADFLCLEKEHTAKGEWAICYRSRKRKTYPCETILAGTLNQVIDRAWDRLCK